MFPHSCGVELARAVANGADPRTVVPDEYRVVRGGTRPVPAAGAAYSAVVGPTLEGAAAAVPHGRIRHTTASEIRASGGIIEWVPEFSPHGTLNQQHVHVTEYGATSFSEPQPNSVARTLRIDKGR
jgi:hypothetical protein